MEDLEVDAAAQVLMHELGHHFLRKNKIPSSFRKDDEEVVVDGAAFIVCEVLGIDTEDSDFVYLASWSREENGEVDIEYTRSLLQHCGKLARFILKRLEEIEEGLEQNEDINLAAYAEPVAS